MATGTAPPSSSAFAASSSSSLSSFSLPRPAANNTVLLFDSGNSLRNCTGCSAPVHDCAEAQANMLCSCRTVLRSALPSAGLREPGSGGLVTVWLREPWLREPWVLGELLNGSAVGHLRLALCGAGTPPVASQYLTLFGLRTLAVNSTAPGLPPLYRELDLERTVGAAMEGKNSLDTTSSSSILHVTFLDVAVLNSLSALKAYSVVGPPVSSLSQEFPNLPLTLPVPVPAPSPATPQDEHASPADPQLNSLLTFVY